MNVRLLAVSGSLRAISTNTALLRAAMLLKPAGMEIELYDGLATLPHFNPDNDVDPLPPAVVDWRAKVAAADGLLISSPEYARGIPGSLKNAFDWLVSGPEHPGKPIAFFQASERGVASQAALRLVLETMGTRIVDSACITINLLGSEKDAAAVAANPDYAAKLTGALNALVEAIAS
ncbi:MAG: NAD(P)H-dependent oxidoreductase [Proteobacteria bacterium]|nr:NAD(P)H-dependent oxidoreductase [Pseudomonadota bacterium]